MSAPRRTGRLKMILGFIVLALLTISALAAVLWSQQERIVFQPPRGIQPVPEGVRRVEYVAEDGTRLFAYVVGGATPGARVLVVFHGNADLATWQVPWARELAQRTGWTVLLPEYRGYDGNPGTPTYAGSALDARAALAVARDTLGARTVALFGHSLGSAIAAELATHMDTAGAPPAALLLQSPLTSARDMARIIIARPLFALWTAIARVHFDTRARVATLDVPVHVAHGDRDLVIPVRMGRAVHAAARRPGALLVVPGAGHNDVAEAGGAGYARWLEDALVEAASAPDARAGRSGAPARP